MYAEQMQKCTSCEQLKSESEFYNYKHEHSCKACMSEKRKAAYRLDPETMRAKKRNYTKANPDKVKSTKLKQAYGITLKEYNEMLAKQNHVCAICGEPETAVWRGRVLSLAVDHCHDTRQVRGLLCMKCNRALGLLKTSISNTVAMLDYIKKYLKLG